MSPRTNTTSKSSHPDKAKKSPTPDHEPRSAHELQQLKKRTDGGYKENPTGTGLLTAANLQRAGDARQERLKHFQEARTLPDNGQHDRKRKVEKYVEEWEGEWKRAERR